MMYAIGRNVICWCCAINTWEGKKYIECITLSEGRSARSTGKRRRWTLGFRIPRDTTLTLLIVPIRLTTYLCLHLRILILYQCIYYILLRFCQPVYNLSIIPVPVIFDPYTYYQVAFPSLNIRKNKKGVRRHISLRAPRTPARPKPDS
jgi:hypothetical protein